MTSSDLGHIWRGADSNIDRCFRGLRQYPLLCGIRLRNDVSFLHSFIHQLSSSTLTRRAPFANCKLVFILFSNGQFTSFVQLFHLEVHNSSAAGTKCRCEGQ